jgi:23S rRNA G2069 N7-methylase RlmK/C1962 C5-methylase RlmI
MNANESDERKKAREKCASRKHTVLSPLNSRPSTMLSTSYFLRDRRATRKFAEQLARSARIGDVFCLQGFVSVHLHSVN